MSFAPTTIPAPAPADLELIAESIPHVVWVADRTGSTEHINRRGRDYTGRPAGAIRGWDWLSSVHPDDAERARSSWKNARRAESELELECRIRRADRAFRWHSVHSFPLRSVTGEIVNWIGTATDVNDQRLLEDRLRRAADESVALEALQSTAPLGLGFVDRQSRWVRVNEALAAINGAAVEEHVGHTVAELMPTLRPRVSRLCRRVLETGRPLLDQEIVKGGMAWRASLYPVEVEGELIGVGMVVVAEGVHAPDGEELRLDVRAWVKRTRDALDEDRLMLYSQPIVPLAGGDPSEELLLRMIGRSGEVVRPARFLPAAEKCGLIGEIDRRVVTEAARLAAGGRRVQANLSARSVSSPGLLHLIEHALSDAGAKPSDLVLEITETALMEDVEAGCAFAQGVTEIGCDLALDDFGTGYSSLARLKRLPIKYLKIDIEFVRDLVSNAGSRHVLEAIIALAKGFGSETIAEGVEDDATLALLRESGVDFAQGYHLGRPAPLMVAGNGNGAA